MQWHGSIKFGPALTQQQAVHLVEGDDAQKEEQEAPHC
jgi:hypothetical protein